MFLFLSTLWTSVQLARPVPLLSPAAFAFAVGFHFLVGTQPIEAAPAFYWRGGDASWSNLSNWAESADGATAYNAATYGVASFNTAEKQSIDQTITLDVDRTIEGLDFTTSSSTTIIGKNNRTLQLYRQITVGSTAGAVTIGSEKEGQRVNLRLNSEPNTWTNRSASALTFQNDVRIGDWSALTVTGAGDTFVNGVISQKAGNDTLVKSGAGVLTLSGNNTYQGTTTVNEGTLVINGNQSKATGAVTVSGPGALLAGSGTVGGNTAIGKGAIHSPGATGAVGKQSFDQAGTRGGVLTYDAGSIFSWDIDTERRQTRGTGYDAVDISGSLEGGDAIFRIVTGEAGFKDAFWMTAQTWSDIFTSGGKSVSGWTKIFSGGLQFLTSTGVEISPEGIGSFSLNGDTLAWTPEFTAVPEPTNALVSLLIAAGLLRRRRA